MEEEREVCVCMYDVRYRSVLYIFEFVVDFCCWGGWVVVVLFVFLYDTLCGLFGWNSALHVYRISYLG